MVDEPKGIEVEEKVTPVTPEKPTEAEVKDELTGPEVEMAKKHDLLKKEGDDKKKQEEDKSEEEKKVAADKAEQDKKAEEDKTKVKAGDDDGVKEHEMLKDYNRNEQALYFKQKKEVRKRQAAEIDRDMLAVKLKVAEEQIAVNKEKKAKPDDIDDVDDLFTDGKKKKEEKKESVREEIERIDKEKAVVREEQDRKANLIRERVIEQGEEAKIQYEDFDSVLDLTQEVLSNHKQLFADQPKKIVKVERLYKAWVVAAANALDDNQEENAADIAYELGQMHPNYKAGQMKAEDGQGSKKIERMVDNAGKRPASASVTGSGGRKLIKYEDMNMSDLANLPRSEFAKVPREVRDRILQRN